MFILRQEEGPESFLLIRRSPSENCPQFLIDGVASGSPMLRFGAPALACRKIAKFHVDGTKQGTRAEVFWRKSMRFLPKAKRIVQVPQISHRPASGGTERGSHLRWLGRYR